jgi:hypothetical protein
MAIEYLLSIGQDRVVKDVPLSEAYRAMIEDKNQCQDQDQGQGQDQGQDQIFSPAAVPNQAGRQVFIGRALRPAGAPGVRPVVFGPGPRRASAPVTAGIFMPAVARDQDRPIKRRKNFKKLRIIFL